MIVDVNGNGRDSRAGPVHRGARVLHLEDSEADAELVANALRDEGLACAITHVNNRAAFESALDRGEFDAILSDFSVPGYDGFAALDLARLLAPGVPFLLVSGVIGEERAVEAMRRGVTDCVNKDRLERLGPALRRALREAESLRAHKRAVASLRGLQSVTAALTAVVTARDVGEAVCAQTVEAASARAAACWTVAGEDRALRLLASAGYPAIAVERLREIPAGGNTVAARVVSTGRPEWHRARGSHGHAEMNLAGASTGPHPTPSAVEFAGQGTLLVCMPLALDGPPMGALSVVFDGRRDLDDDDRALLLAVARQCAQALDRVRFYEAERDARQRLEQAHRLKDEFFATVSHELRAPLNAILGWSKLLREGNLPPEKQGRAVETIERNARAQAKLVEDLLDVSRIMAGKLSIEHQRLDPRQIVLGAVETVRPAAEAKGLALAAEIDEEAQAVDGDPGRLQQVVSNLLTNAVKFTPRGGTVRAVLAREGHGVRVTVRDTGNGIDPAFLPFVFERFRQDAGGPRYGGLGLGLAIVRHIVELHGGNVRAHSEGKGCGAEFSVWFPAATGEAPRPGENDRANTAAGDVATTVTGRRVLLVDDDRDGLELFANALTAAGAEVTTADSADAAIEVVQALRPHVVVSDIGLPGEDGYSLARRLRAAPGGIGTRIGAVALTAFGRPEDRAHALAAGFDFHLTKPVAAADLVATVARAAVTRTVD